MLLKKSKIVLVVMCLMTFANFSKAQTGTLEMTSTGSSNTITGPSTAPVVVAFREDIQNLTFGTFFQPYTPGLTVTTSFANQQYNTNYFNMNTGMAFGGGTTASTGGTVQQSASNFIYNALGATLVQPPLNGMFVSSSTGAIVPNYQLGGRGVGLDPEATQNGTDLATGNFDYSFGMAIYTTVEPLWDANLAKDGRYYYGDLIINFSHPVVNPVIHVGGLGGSYNYQPIGGGPRLISYFSSELELQNTGVTSTFMAGNEYFNISGNKILNSAPRPNGGSYDDGSQQGGFSTYGAATGSVRVNGTVTQLVYKVYVRGSINSDFNFSKNQADIIGATRDPFNGDLFYLAVSLNKPAQIFGNVFNDRDQLTDRYIDSSLTLGTNLANAGTNISGQLFANLKNNAGNVVASVPVAADGSYYFDNVPVGTYSVQLTKNSSTGTYALPQPPPVTALPPLWVNTGERNGRGLDGDGAVNGLSASFTLTAANAVQYEVNFGVRIQDPGAASCTLPQLHTDQNPANQNSNFGDFEAGASNFGVWVNGFPATASANSSWRATTNLSAAQYDITHSPALISGTFDPFPAFSPSPSATSKMMFVKNPTAGVVAWSLYDTTAKLHNNNNNLDSQYYFRSGVQPQFAGYLSRVNSGSPIVRIRIYNADNNATFNSANGLITDTTITLTKPSGQWHPFVLQPKLDVYAPQPARSTVKKIRWDISSVNGVPFAIDGLCLDVMPIILPIKISSFTATKQTNSVLLNWKTSIESNSKNFEVQFSKDGGNLWQTIGIVAAAGNSSTERNYSFVHTNPVTGANYYRLKMVDLDANYELSQTRVVTFDKIGSIVVLPNPVVDRVYITSNSTVGLRSVTVYSAAGQLLQQNENFVSGSSVDMRNFAAGTYMLRITDKQGNTEVVKVVKGNK